MQLSKATDKVLIREYLDGNENAFAELMGRYKTKIYQNIYFMVNDQELAEDIFQDTFIKVINTLKQGRYNEEGKFYPWASRIAHNLAIDFFRKEKKMRTVSGGDDYDIFKFIKMEDENIEDGIIRGQIEDDIRQLVHTLPEEQKQVVLMRHYQGMSFKDISDSTGVSINTALGRMRYALINMRKLIEEKGMILTMD